MSYPLYIFFGVAPSIIWLLFYLRKDTHPESNRMILRVFFYGMLATLPAILLEWGILEGLKKINLSPVLVLILSIFIGVALVEEILKYLVIRKKVLNSSELDEPLDIMLYMIIAALGFAAFENISKLFPLGPDFLFKEVFSISVFRFLGATFLHALCSGTLGYFMALSFYNTKRRLSFLLLGLGTATFLHGLFNLSIIKIGESLVMVDSHLVITNSQMFFSSLALLIVILIGLAIFVTFGFKRLKKIKSICLPDLPSATQGQAGKI